MKSILQEDSKCFFCKSNSWLEQHHVFGGANRNKSEKYGLTVILCHFCHNEPPNGVHHNAYRNKRLKEIAQEVYMQYYNKTIEEFIKEFGKNYL